MEGLASEKTKKPLKKVNHKGNIKFSNPLLPQKTYQIRIRVDLLKGCLTYKNPHLLPQHISK
jgi:hypothetical protein